jgi:hypothetical protein
MRDATFGSLNMRQIICIKLECVLDILFASGVGLPSTRKVESIHLTTTSARASLLHFVLKKMTLIGHEPTA